MPSTIDQSLLESGDPAPVELLRPQGQSVFVLTADHAGRAIPRRLGSLGLSAGDLEKHIAWDIGVGEVARLLSAALDAPLVLQAYSRLVIDCNRDPAVESSIAAVSEHTRIPANENVTRADAVLRRRNIFDPYHAAIAGLLNERKAAAMPSIMIALHSMTPVFKGQSRAMHTAVLYDQDGRFAHCVLRALREESELIVAENQPYFVSPATDYTIPHHAEGRLPYAEIEIRQDLIAGQTGQREWSERLARVLRSAQQDFSGRYGPG
jgi:predicted N-formylglutamate amidohydrolase